jgi:processive 1,2-diacylglycerol beta-glucosyltransferase
MGMADLIVSKSGGLTVSEALASELPMVITPPIPGQEAFNAQFLVNNGAAVSCEDYSHISKVIFHLLKNPLELQKMRCAAREIKRPFSAEHAASVLVGMLAGSDKETQIQRLRSEASFL